VNEATFQARAIPATLERRERAAPALIRAADRARSAQVKQSLKSRLFGIAITLSAFAIMIHPLFAKRW
jgi:hypothetical protein